MTSQDILEIIIKQNLISIYLYTAPFNQSYLHLYFIFEPHTPTHQSSLSSSLQTSKSALYPSHFINSFFTLYSIVEQSYTLISISLWSLQMIKISHENLLGLKIRNYTFVKVIGEGQYARVYEAFNSQTNQSVAAKVFPKQLFKRNSKLMELVKTEIRVLKECKNQNVVRYVDNFMSEKSLLIFMELCNGGELQVYLDQRGRLLQEQATVFLKQIINGFKGLHQAKAMHRDFKASNVLLHNSICKIADLGFAKQVDEEQMTRTLLGSGLTMAPQVHQQKSYGRKADIWSVAVVFYQLIYGDYPFKGISDHQILKNIITNRPNYSKVNISEKGKDFIERCLVVDPKKRIGWKELYSHPLIVDEEQSLFDLRSSIKLQQNKEFYDRESCQQKVQKYREEDKIEHKKIEVVNEHLQRLKLQQERNNIEQAVKVHLNHYLNRRNSIMFIFKHIVSNIITIQKKISANHSITLFIICKKAYLDMKQFNLHLTSYQNIGSFNEHFQDFTSSQYYRNLCEQIKSDISLINLQMKQYCLILPKTLNEEVRHQFDLQKASHPNWNSFVLQILQNYENELIGNLDDVSASQKRTVVKLVEALQYFRELKNDSEVQQFDKHIEGLCYSQKQLELRQRWIKKLTGYQ